jgi:hypothetical protein
LLVFGLLGLFIVDEHVQLLLLLFNVWWTSNVVG